MEPNWGTVPDWIVAGAAIVAVIMACVQIQTANSLSKRNYASQVWLEYIKIGLEHPELGEDWIAMREHRISSLEELVAGESLASQRYLWFLTMVLDACDAILRNLSRPLWDRTIRAQITFHKGALERCWATGACWSKFYGPRLNRLISEELSRSSNPESERLRDQLNKDKSRKRPTRPRAKVIVSHA